MKTLFFRCCSTSLVAIRDLPRQSFMLIAVLACGLAHAGDEAPGTFRVWVFSDAHVDTDKRNGRESLAIALRQSESTGGFAWDIALDLGDLSGAQGTPKDAEGQEIVRQFSVLQRHRREQIYDLSGNHDRSGLDEPQAWWWREWIDPTGEHSALSGVDASKRPFPIEGTWERYSFRVGNMLFLMMSDINEPSQKVGRGTLGGNPGGVVSGETFRWWKRMVEENHYICVGHGDMARRAHAHDPRRHLRRQITYREEREYDFYQCRGLDPVSRPSGKSGAQELVADIHGGQR